MRRAVIRSKENHGLPEAGSNGVEQWPDPLDVVQMLEEAISAAVPQPA